MSKRIAVVGVGLMGSSLARHLVTAGFPVTVHDVDPAKVDALVKLGAKKAAAPERIAARGRRRSCSRSPTRTSSTTC